MRPRARARRHDGFTLLEVLAVVLLTSLVFTAAVDFYLELSRKSAHAAELTRGVRRASAILDRVARDLEGAVLLVKPDDVDPTQFPWLFLAETGDDRVGADRIKFMTRSHVPQTSATPESDLEVVAYAVRPGEDGTLELVRWSSAQLPELLDRSIPTASEDGAVVLARGVESFGVKLLSEAGEWKSTWDSSTVVDSSQLPVAAEIAVALAPTEGEEPAAGEDAPAPFVRRVLMPLRPLDLEAVLSPEAAEKDAEGDEEDQAEADEAGGMTVAECLARNPGLALPIDPAALASIQGQSAATVAKSAGVELPVSCR